MTANLCRRQLGHGDLKDRTKPTSVRRLWEMQLFKTRRGETFKPVAVAAGNYHTLVLVERGSGLQGAHGPWQQVVSCVGSRSHADDHVQLATPWSALVFLVALTMPALPALRLGR